MLSSLRTIAWRGWQMLRRHSELWFVAVLVVVLPALFLVLTSATLDTAITLTNNAEKARISTTHDAIELVVRTSANVSAVAPLLTQLTERNRDIKTFQVIFDSGENLVLTASEAGEENKILTAGNNHHRLALTDPGSTFITGQLVAGAREWHAYRVVERAQNERYYLYSVHSLVAVDAKIKDRVRTTYTVLVAIIVFLAALAYWVSRQIDYRARYEEAQVAIKEHELFTSSIVHELRAPLTALRGYAALIAETTEASKPVRDYAEKIRLGTVRLVALISDYLEVTRIRSGLHTLTLGPVPVHTLLKQVAGELSPLAAEKHITLSVQAKDATEIEVAGAEKYLTQIFTNLLSNAIKYTPRGHVEIEYGHDGHGGVEVRIKDTGMGMSAEDQSRLFAPFSRVGDSTSKAVTGSGLGMWITKLMVEQLGGTIGVESIKGIGTHVVVRFKK